MTLNNINSQHQHQPSFIALLPFLLFLTLFIGLDNLPAPVAAIPAIILALCLGSGSLNSKIAKFIAGAGDQNILSMCFIFLLAGAFSTVTQATGGVDATVNLGLSIIPPKMLLPGFFFIACFISLAMGTSMGTIAAVAPIAYGVANATSIDAVYMAGSVLSGAMFGDNLSIISDTTIAACNTQGCSIKDKFWENFKLAIPAMLITLMFFYYLSSDVNFIQIEEFAYYKVLPYILILILSLLGINVLIVLTIGIAAAGILGIFDNTSYAALNFFQDIYLGFNATQEIFLLSLFMGGLGYLMEQYGGMLYINNMLETIIKKLSRKAYSAKMAMLSISAVVGLTNLCTSNNTIAIVISGSIVKNVSNNYNLPAKVSASYIDIFSCIVQGLIPYGAQILLLSSSFNVKPATIVSYSIYSMVLLIVTVVFTFFKK